MAGRMTIDNFVPPNGSIKDEHIVSSATSKIDADKLQHIHKPGTAFALAIGGTVASREEIVFVASATGSIRAFHCTMNVGGTAGDSDFDLKVNGVSVLSGVVNFANGDADKLIKDGTISDPSLSADDIVSISVTRNSSHDGTGPFAWVEIEENAG
jgi:hypothetical protein